MMSSAVFSSSLILQTDTSACASEIALKLSEQFSREIFKSVANQYTKFCIVADFRPFPRLRLALFVPIPQASSLESEYFGVSYSFNYNLSFL